MKDDRQPLQEDHETGRVGPVITGERKKQERHSHSATHMDL
jgi:hypothetical protein